MLKISSCGNSKQNIDGQWHKTAFGNELPNPCESCGDTDVYGDESVWNNVSVVDDSKMQFNEDGDPIGSDQDWENWIVGEIKTLCKSCADRYQIRFLNQGDMPGIPLQEYQRMLRESGPEPNSPQPDPLWWQGDPDRMNGL